jgi:hypothetical protein
MKAQFAEFWTKFKAEAAESFAWLQKKLTSQQGLNNALLLAGGEGDVKWIGKLLARGADPKYIGYAGRTALIAAVEGNHLRAAEMLLRAGASADVQSRHNTRTPLITAARRRDVEMVRALVAGGAGIDYPQREEGRTALMAAVRRNDMAMAKVLLDLGANPDVRDKAGNTALNHAILHADMKVISLLLDRGACADMLNNEMKGPLDIARGNGRPKVVSLLQDHMDARVEPWQAQGDREIAHVRVKRQLGYRLTEIFNFETQQLTVIAHNLATGADAVAVRAFPEVPKEALLQAETKLTESLSGKTPAAAAP